MAVVFCVKCGGKRYSRQREGSGAFGTRVLSFLRFAPNDGFCPQSGLVQRGDKAHSVETGAPKALFYDATAGRHRNPRPEGPSNLRTLRPIGPVNPKNPPRPAVSSPFGTAYHLSARSSVGRQKESALMGRLGALLRPTWRSYAGPPQWHNKPQIPAELSPHPSQIYDSFTSHCISMCYYISNK